jgi:F-type H+-transporting ATPase subunit a
MSDGKTIAMAAEYENASEYITHHLTFFTKPVGDGAFWTLNVDTLIVGALMGIVSMGFFCWIVRGATAGVPNKRQAFAEWLFEFVDDQVRDIYHGDRNKFVGPLAFTVFFWVVLMNSMDFLPVDIVALFLPNHPFRIVPTADVNTTFALALAVWGLMIGAAVTSKGVGGFIHEIFCTPFGANPFLWILNLAFNLVEYISKPLSHSLRLFGNMYAGEIIYLLLWLLASAGIVGAFFAIPLGIAWSFFHILIVLLQAYIFMMLTVVYVQMGHESH